MTKNPPDPQAVHGNFQERQEASTGFGGLGCDMAVIWVLYGVPFMVLIWVLIWLLYRFFNGFVRKLLRHGVPPSIFGYVSIGKMTR